MYEQLYPPFSLFTLACIVIWMLWKAHQDDVAAARFSEALAAEERAELEAALAEDLRNEYLAEYSPYRVEA